MTAQQEVPTLLVVVPLAVVVAAAWLFRLHRRSELSRGRGLLVVVAVVYGAGVVANTVFPIYLGGPQYDVPWRAYLHLTPFVGAELQDVAQNVVVFLPLGVLLPLLTRVRTWRGVLLVGFALSLTMELVQLVNSITGHGGHVADVNDLLANTVGAPLGFALFSAVRRAGEAAAAGPRARGRR